jgi:hypothetical protein
MKQPYEDPHPTTVPHNHWHRHGIEADYERHQHEHSHEHVTARTWRGHERAPHTVHSPWHEHG